MNTSIEWERVEKGLDVWETEDGYRREVYARGDGQQFVCKAPDGSTFFSHDPADIDQCVRIHREGDQ